MRRSYILAREGRGRLRRLAVATTALVLPLGIAAGVLGTSSAGAVAHAGTGTTVTYTAVVNIPAPPASNFASGGGGDGWAVGLTSTAVYNVFHHQGSFVVMCHLQSDASVCAGYAKTITDAKGDGFATSGQPGLWVDQANGHLYAYATRTSDNTGGVVCVDTTQPSSVADPFCGFTALTGVGQAQRTSIGNISDPVVVGTNWYAFNYFNGVPTGTEDKLLCFSLTTYAGCPKQPYAVPIGLASGLAVNDDTFPEPSIAAVAGHIVVPITVAAAGAIKRASSGDSHRSSRSVSAPPVAPAASAGSMITCFDAIAGKTCSGSWPASSTAYNYPSPTNSGTGGGAPFPLLNAQGTATGVCLPVSGGTGPTAFADPCYGLNGASVPTPKNLPSVIAANPVWDSPALTIGSRIYLPQGTFSSVDQTVACFDYTSGAKCANFPKDLGPSGNLELLYSVNPDPQRPTCIWVNADGGSQQIQNFDAFTGGACGTGPLRVLASSVVAPHPICNPGNWLTLQILQPPRKQYSSGTITFDNSDGTPLAGVPTQSLDSTGSADLSKLNLSAKSALPQFLITLNNPPPKLSQVEVKLTWSAPYSKECLQPGTTAGPPPPGYRLEGGDGGIFDFHVPYHGSVGFPSPPGLGLHIFNFVGMTPTANGYWLVQRNGGVFSFGDAHFHGSLPNSNISVDNIVGIAGTPDGGGYWIVASDGTVYPFGDAAHLGSLTDKGLTASDIVAIDSPDAGGYWLVGADGGVFGFGDAHFHGSCPAVGSGCEGVRDVVGMTSPDTGGYWLVGDDGGVFSFGDAHFHGSCPVVASGCDPVTGVVGIASPDSGGYWLAQSDGNVFTFGDAKFFGECSTVNSGCKDLVRPIVAIS